MVKLNVRTREVGAVATAATSGSVTVTTPTGGSLDVVTPPAAPGFSPLDLIYASLASCLVISTKMAAVRQGVQDRLGDVRVQVTGEKAHEGPSRIERFDIVFDISGDLTSDEKQALMHAAEGEICTVSNTLQGAPVLTARHV
ncbi:OsmC family protein [Rhizobium sp. RU36D]|uniref:OsmC family protein n=1 Tax=Rhizobium sp. RU36D TaxID=1907415 RepID=UPI0009D8B5CF|nr:OsmC family protein [Rhizobium sp. RU36D]SMC82874.1 Uncharacterized OsmC-related protein [Rhizobium sp. RU36D]